MSHLMQYAHGLKWKLLLTGNDVHATFVGEGVMFKIREDEHKQFQFKKDTSPSPPRTGDWTFITSTSGQYALGWFVSIKNDDPAKYIVALTSAHDIHFEVERRNFYNLSNMIAVRDSSECIRLSDPSPYRDVLLILAKGTVQYVDRQFCVNQHQSPSVEENARQREIRSKTNMLRNDIRRREAKRQVRDLAIRALVRLLPFDTRRKISVFAEFKEKY